MFSVLLLIAIVMANVLGAGMALPQASRIIRTRQVEGVSPVWAGISVAMNGWWLAYGLNQELWGLVPVSAVSVVLYSIIAMAFFRSAPAATVLRGLFVGAFGLGALPLPFLILRGWQSAGVVIGLCYGLQLLPAVIASFRSTDLRGVAAGTWVLAWFEAAIWLFYAFAVSDVALTYGGVSGLVMSSLILFRLSTTGYLRPRYA